MAVAFSLYQLTTYGIIHILIKDYTHRQRIPINLSQLNKIVRTIPATTTKIVKTKRRNGKI